MLLLLTAIVMLSWTTTLADSTDQYPAPGRETVQQAESAPISPSDSVKVNVYKTLLEDQRNTTDKILASQQTSFVIALATITLVIMVILTAAGFITLNIFRRKIEQAKMEMEQRLDKRVKSLVEDNDNFVMAVYNTIRGEMRALEYRGMSEARKKEREGLNLIALAFTECLTTIGSLVKIFGYTQNLKGLYELNLTGIEEALQFIPAENMSQSHVSALRRDLERIRAMPIWSGDNDLLNQIDNVEKVLNEENRPSPFDDLKKESDSEG